MSSILCEPAALCGVSYVSFGSYETPEEARAAVPEVPRAAAGDFRLLAPQSQELLRPPKAGSRYLPTLAQGLHRCEQMKLELDQHEPAVRRHAAKTMTIFRSENSVHKNIPLVEILLSLAVYGPLTRSRLLKHFSRKSPRAVHEFDRAVMWLIDKGAVSARIADGPKAEMVYSFANWTFTEEKQDDPSVDLG